MKSLSYYPLCITYHLNQLPEDHPCSRTMSMGSDSSLCGAGFQKGLQEEAGKR